MTTPAQSNFSGSASKQPDAGFEASGLSPEEAERLAAAFKPSWEFDEAPFTPFAGGAGLDAGQIETLGAVDGEARTVAPHAPPQRVETHEPEVSVIIDRSITAAELDAQRLAAAPQPSRPAPPPPPAAVASPFASPAFAAPALAPPTPQRVAPVMRSPRGASPDESLELPASLKKSNKGLFIGLGIAVAAAALVLIVHGAMSSPDPSPGSPSTAAPVATTAAPTEAQRAMVPAVPPPVANPPPTPVVQPVPPPPAVAVAAPAPRPSPVAAPKPQQHPAAAPPPQAHHAAPRNPPKPAAGGIVRDVPF
jgi:hypothetical protein